MGVKSRFAGGRAKNPPSVFIPRPKPAQAFLPGQRYALLLAGQPRTFEYCFPSLKRHLLDIYHPDVFICSDDQGKRLKELYQPAGIEIHSQDEIWQAIGDRRTRYTSHSHETVPEKDLSVMWKAWRLGEMLRGSEAQGGKYDTVIISRFDVKFNRIQPIGRADENLLYVPYINAFLSPPDPVGHHYGGYSTQLCWCSSRTASLLCDMYWWGEQYYQQAGEWHSERMLAWFMERHGIKAQPVDISMMIIRGTSQNPMAFDGKPLSDYPEFL